MDTHENIVNDGTDDESILNDDTDDESISYDEENFLFGSEGSMGDDSDRLDFESSTINYGSIAASSVHTEDILNDQEVIDFGNEFTFEDHLEEFGESFNQPILWGTESDSVNTEDFRIADIVKYFLVEGNYKIKTRQMTSCSNGHLCGLCSGSVPKTNKIVSINYGKLSDKFKWILRYYAPEIMTILHKYFDTDVTFHNLELIDTFQNWEEQPNCLIAVRGSVIEIKELRREPFQSIGYCQNYNCKERWKDCGCTKMYDIVFTKLYHHFKMNQTSNILILIDFSN